MTKIKIEENYSMEELRVRDLVRLNNLDEVLKSSINELAELIAKTFSSEICLISLIDSNVQQILYQYGYSIEVISRDTSFCSEAMNASNILIIEDLKNEKRFANNPLLKHKAERLSFAGVPLISQRGLRIGALSIISSNNLSLTEYQIKLLSSFSKQIINELELYSTKNEIKDLTRHFNEIQNISQTGRWELDVVSSKTVWSEEIYKIYNIPVGTPTDKVLGLSYYKEEDQERLSKLINQSIENQSNFEGEFQFIDSKGTHKWVRSRGYPAFDHNGSLTKITGTLQDITIQKKNQLVLLKHSSEIEAYAKTLNNYGLVTKSNIDGKITFANELFCSSSGYSLSELIGNDHRMISSGKHSKQFFKEMWDTIKSGNQWRGEIQNKSKSGDLFWVDTIITPVLNSQGEIVEFFAFRFEISDRKKVNEKLERNALEKQLFFDQAIDAIMTLRPPEWKFTSANPATLKLFDVPKEVDIHSLGPWSISPEFQPDGQKSADKAKKMIQFAIENGSHYFDWTHCKLNGVEMQCNVLLSKITEGDNFYLNATVRDISQEKKIESQLVEAQEISKVGSWTYDVRNNLLSWSLEHYKIFEIDYPQESEVLYKMYREKIHHEDLVMLDGLMDGAVNRGEDFVFNHRVILSDDRIKFVQGIGKVVRDNQNHTIFLKGTCRDRSYDVEREQNYRNLMESISEGIVVQDETGSVIDFNNSSLQIFELDAQQLIGKSKLGNKWRIINPKGHEVDSKNHPGLVTLRTGKPIINLILGLKFETGRVKWICINTNPIKDSGGRKVISTVSDITELIATKDENRFVLDTIGIGIWKFRLDTKELKWDSSMYKLFNINEEDFTGDYQAWESSLTPESKEAAVKALNDAIAGIKEFDITFEIQTKDQDKRFIGGKAKVIRDKNGNPMVVYGINWDRTKEVELEKSLDAERLKSFQNARLASIGQLAAGVGHEINNPLAIIAGHLSIVRDDLNTPNFNREKVFNRFQKIDHSIERISNIVNILRNFARSDEGQLVKFDPYVLVQETIDMLTDLYLKENAKIILNGSHESRLIYGNKNRMQQVFINLFNNAKDAMVNLEEKIINLNVSYDPNNIIITFADKGCGIPDDLKEKIFIPFFTTKQVNKGTGIGLSLVSTIIREHNGAIEVKSKVGEGSQFIVSLPVQNSTGVELEYKEEELIVHEKISCRVLIVDDEEDLRDISKFVFSKICTSVSVADSAETALQLLNENKFDLVVSDIKMPQIDGFEFFKLIQSNKALEKLKFMFISGGVSLSDDNQREIEDNSLIVLSKPLDEKFIMKTLQEMFL